jgi:DNA recombination protein RmuC
MLDWPIVIALSTATGLLGLAAGLLLGRRSGQGARDEMKAHFEALSAETLRKTTDDFLRVAGERFAHLQTGAQGDLEQRRQAVESLVKPLQDSLQKVDGKLAALEKARAEAYGGLVEQLRALASTHDALRAETGSLVKALRAPNVRGRWGEVQLERVVELAGMTPHCDFSTQATLEGDEGRLRPDLLVHLPGGKQLVVDAKAPLSAYLDALETDDEAVRKSKLVAHAKQIRDHMGQLASKAYWDRLPAAPEFVVMFLPGEAFFGAALEQDPGLVEAGMEQRVVLATPTTLIALLRSVAFGWRQERIAENAQAISDLGRTLHERMGVVARHLAELGKRLDGAVAAYNKAVGSVESRMMPAAKRLEEMGAAGGDGLPSPKPVDRAPRGLRAVEDEEEPEADAPGGRGGRGVEDEAEPADAPGGRQARPAGEG